MFEDKVKFNINGKTIFFPKKIVASAYAGASSAKNCTIIDSIVPNSSDFKEIYNKHYSTYLDVDGDFSSLSIGHKLCEFQIIAGTIISNSSGTKKQKATLGSTIKIRHENNVLDFEVIPRKHTPVNSNLCVINTHVFLPDFVKFYTSRICFGPSFIKSRGDFPLIGSPSEEKAQRTLRDMLSEPEFKKYLKYGFVSILASSGKVYQVFRNTHHIKVWHKGILEEELCVYIKNPKIPPTDKIIAFLIMIMSDEQDLRQISNRYKMIGNSL